MILFAGGQWKVELLTGEQGSKEKCHCISMILFAGGQWKVELLTGEQGAKGEAEDLVIVMCGDKGESNPINFNSSRDKPFQPRQTEVSHVCKALTIYFTLK